MARPKEFDIEQVLDRALEKFWKESYHSITMDELLKSIGMNRASFYSYFGNKEALYKRVLQRYQNWQQVWLRKIIENNISPLQIIRELFLQAVQESVQDKDKKGCFMVNCTIEFANKDEEISRDLRNNEQDMEKFFQDLIIQARERKEIKSTEAPEVLATYLFSSLQGLKVTAKTNQDQALLNRMVGVILANL